MYTFEYKGFANQNRVMCVARLFNREIKVETDQKENPRFLKHYGSWEGIKNVLEVWKDTGTWWDGEAEKTFYRVEAAGGSVYEIYLNSGNGKWYLYRIYD